MNAQPTGNPREWSVDWEVKVDVTITKTLEYGASQIIEADSAEAAVEKVKNEEVPAIAENDLDLEYLTADDIQAYDVDADTFKLTAPVSEWS